MFISDFEYYSQRSCIWLVACKLSIIFGLSTSRFLNFTIYLFYWKSLNLKIWRLSKYTLTLINQLPSYELYTLLGACLFYLNCIITSSFGILNFSIIRVILSIHLDADMFICTNNKSSFKSFTLSHTLPSNVLYLLV